MFFSYHRQEAKPTAMVLHALVIAVISVHTPCAGSMNSVDRGLDHWNGVLDLAHAQIAGSSALPDMTSQ